MSSLPRLPIRSRSVMCMQVQSTVHELADRWSMEIARRREDQSQP